MKKYGKICLSIFLLLFVIEALFGCGSAADKSAVKTESGTYYGAEEASGEPDAKSPTSEAVGQAVQSRKIIEYVNLSVETKTFDKLIEGINAEVKQAGGYIESSEIKGSSYYGSENRTAELKLRIPKKQQSDFSDFLSKNCNVVSRSVSTDDVTDRYIDTQSRIKALTLEKETFEKLLTQTSDISDTMTVYEKLTDVIAEIESYQGKLNQMDNLIDYTTFTVYIDEVAKEKVKSQNWFVKTWRGLSDNFSAVGIGLLNFFSFMIAALPYWILLGVIFVVVRLIIRRFIKKKK